MPAAPSHTPPSQKARGPGRTEGLRSTYTRISSPASALARLTDPAPQRRGTRRAGGRGRPSDSPPSATAVDRHAPKSAVKRAFRRFVARLRARSPRPVTPRPWAPRAAPLPPGRVRAAVWVPCAWLESAESSLRDCANRGIHAACGAVRRRPWVSPHFPLLHLLEPEAR